MYKSLYYNALIDQPADGAEPYRVLLVNSGGTIAEISRGEYLSSAYTVNNIGRITDMNRQHLTPPFVHYTRFAARDLLFYGCGLNMKGKTFSSAAEAVSLIKELPALPKRAPLILYNIAADMSAAFSDGSTGELPVKAPDFGHKTCAFFAADGQSAWLSADILKAVGAPDKNGAGRTLTAAELKFRLDRIITYLVRKSASRYAQACRRFAGECADYGIACIVSSSPGRADAALAGVFCDAKCPIKVFGGSLADKSGIFADIAAGESFSPAEGLAEAIAAGRLSPRTVLRLKTGSQFGIKEIPGLFAAGNSADYLLTKGSIEEYAKAGLPPEKPLLMLRDAAVNMNEAAFTAAAVRKNFAAAQRI